MATVSSNLDDIQRLLDRMLDGFNFEWRGTEGKGLANELMDVAAEGMADRTLARQQGPDGEKLADNAPRYKRRRDKAGKPVGVLSGEMLSKLEMDGEREILLDDARMTYGQSEEARKKAEWFTRGSEENPPEDIEASGAKNQPSRPFIGLDETIRGQMHERADQSLNEYLRELQGGGA